MLWSLLFCFPSKYILSSKYWWMSISRVQVFSFPYSLGGWFWRCSQWTRLNEFPAKCQRSQGRASRQRMAKPSMQPLASSTHTKANLWKPKKLLVRTQCCLQFLIWYAASRACKIASLIILAVFIADGHNVCWRFPLNHTAYSNVGLL